MNKRQTTRAVRPRRLAFESVEARLTLSTTGGAVDFQAEPTPLGSVLSNGFISFSAYDAARSSQGSQFFVADGAALNQIVSGFTLHSLGSAVATGIGFLASVILTRAA